MHLRPGLFLLMLCPGLLTAQIALTFDPSVPVSANGQPLPLAWGGGLNCPQVSDIDLDGDGDKDLFFFDRTGNKPVMFLNQGGAGQTNYALTHAYDNVYPFGELHDWALLRDYNCDGKEDLFAYTSGAFAVYKNTSTGSDLSFTLVDDQVGSNYVPVYSPNLFITAVDVPGIEDVDGDGDLDVLTFSILGSYVEYHKNLSMELYGTCDSLAYERRNVCWGEFAENPSTNSVKLDMPCTYNVPHPELPTQIAHATAELAHDVHSLSHERAHAGSTLLPLNLDGDGDEDLILGDLLFPNLVALVNGGNVDSSYMTSQDSIYPNYNVPLNMDIFPAAFYEDVNNDGLRDLIVTPNYPGLSENKRCIWYYKNTGTDQAPHFAFQQTDLFQHDMLDFGEGAYPVFFDHNGDGLMDIVVSNYGYYGTGASFAGKMALLENVGTATAPAFNMITDHYMDFDTLGIGNSMYPAFGDVDGDGDEDMYMGDALGRIHYFRNDPVAGEAHFHLAQATVNSDLDTLIDVGQYATPQFFDMDDDGVLDLLVGERNGNINYFHNTGTVTNAVWHLENDSVGGVVVAEWWNITGFSVPCMHRNEDGSRELLVGSESGWIYQYDNIDGNLNGVWNQVDSTWQDLHDGARTAIALHDLDGDGHLDAVIGNYRGGLSYWRNDIDAGIRTINVRNASEAFSLAPNPAANEVTLTVNMAVSASTRLEVLDDLGRTVRSMAVRDKRITLSTADLHNGVYMLRLGDGVARWTQRLVVMH